MSAGRIPGGSVVGGDDAGGIADFRRGRIPGPSVSLGDAGEPPPPPPPTPTSASFGQPGVSDRLRLDPELSAHVDQLVAAAEADGYRRGHDDGRLGAERRLDALAQSIALAVSGAEDHMERTRQGTIGGVLDLAREIARHVIGRTPHDDGAALLTRIAESLDLLDERPLTILVSAEDAEVVRRVAADHRDLHVDVDNGLQAGEALIRGGWSHADLTYEAAWTAIERHLSAE